MNIQLSMNIVFCRMEGKCVLPIKKHNDMKPIYQTTGHHITEDCNLDIHHCENLESHKRLPSL